MVPLHWIAETLYRYAKSHAIRFLVGV